MIIKEYEIFLLNQKDEWLSKNSNKGKFIEADARYHPEIWFAKAIKNSRYAITTHSSTFTHSDAKSTPVLFVKNSSNNGYLVSNNVNLSHSFDVFGNAATDTIVKETYLFLTKKLSDGYTIWQHFENKTEYVQEFVDSLNQDLEKTYASFSKIFIQQDQPRTTGLLKQVYFPISYNNYHLLSLLVSSPLITETLKRVDSIRFDESYKEAKENRKKQHLDEIGYSDLLGLTQIGFGGSKPQNVSILNSQNAGRAYLLSSVPPSFESRKVKLPTRDFFTQCLYIQAYKENFSDLQIFIRKDLDGITGQRKNTKAIRKNIDKTLRKIIEKILFNAFCIRKYKYQWSAAEYYENLPLYQRIWLDDFYKAQREEDGSWFEDVSREIAKWILKIYADKDIVENSYQLGDGELLAVKEIVKELLNEDKRFF